jgi:hypothetical protein
MFPLQPATMLEELWREKVGFLMVTYQTLIFPLVLDLFCARSRT